MVLALNSFDHFLLFAINGAHTSFLDGFMWLVSAKYTWVVFYASILYMLIRNWKKDAVYMILLFILCIVMADQLSSSVVKPIFQRLRPSNVSELAGMLHFVNDYHGGRYGFVSSHAANSAGFALLSALFFRNRIYTIVVVCWALLISYSRVYLGVHYPTDVLGGILIGLFSGAVCYLLIRKLSPVTTTDRTLMHYPVVWSALALTFVGMCIYGCYFPF